MYCMTPAPFLWKEAFLTVAIHATTNRALRPLCPHNGSFNKSFQTAYHTSRKAGPRNACLLVLGMLYLIFGSI
jgi:hypothetical protein